MAIRNCFHTTQVFKMCACLYMKCNVSLMNSPTMSGEPLKLRLHTSSADLKVYFSKGMCYKREGIFWAGREIRAIVQ